MAGFGASDVVVRGRSRRGTAMAVAILLPLAVGLLCEVTGNAEYEELVALFGAAEAIFFFFLPVLAPNGLGFVTGERRGAIRADREGITFRGSTLLTRGQIRNVAVQPHAGGVQSVHVSAARRQDGIVVVLADEAKARAFLDALDVDPERHVATFSVEEDPLRSRWRWLAARALVGAGGVALTLVVLSLARRNELLLLAIVPVLLVYALLLPRARRRSDIALGADGLTLRLRGRTRSIPLSTIAEVRPARNTVTLRIEGGETVVLRFGPDDDEPASVLRTAFSARLRQSLVRRDRGHDPCEDRLARGQREQGEWSRHLQSLLGEGEGYRAAAMPEETLWRIAEGAAAEPSARVGALVALRTRIDEGARARLLGLAEHTAQRDLRAALEAAAEGADADAIIAAYDGTTKR
jgi:hypothetical protein